MTIPTPKAVICSRHHFYSEVLAKAIKFNTNGLDIVSSITEIEDWDYLHEKNKIDFLLFRLDRSIENPLRQIELFKKKNPNVKILALTFWDHPSYNEKLINVGVHDVYIIDQKIDVLIEKMLKPKKQPNINNTHARFNFDYAGGMLE